VRMSTRAGVLFVTPGWASAALPFVTIIDVDCDKEASYQLKRVRILNAT
jgi:hypothetical protein